MGIHRFLKAIGAYTLPDEDIAEYEELISRPKVVAEKPGLQLRAPETTKEIEQRKASETPAEQDRRNQSNIAN
jgi:hypothetical protein